MGRKPEDAVLRFVPYDGQIKVLELRQPFSNTNLRELHFSYNEKFTIYLLIDGSTLSTLSGTGNYIKVRPARTTEALK